MNEITVRIVLLDAMIEEMRLMLVGGTTPCYAGELWTEITV